MTVGIRETINRNPTVTAGVAAGIIVLTLIIIVMYNRAGTPTVGSGSARVFYTIDDGQNWFPDDADKIPPFEKDGKQAVRAHVYLCDGKPQVVYLERYTPDAKKKLEELRGRAGNDPMLAEGIFFTGLQVKKPGQANWINQADERAQKIMMPDCAGTLEVHSPP